MSWKIQGKSFTIPGENIIQDGLVLNLDSGNLSSYPGSGDIWYDLSDNGNNGTLVNGVGYLSDNGGSMVLDGVDDSIYIDSSSDFNWGSGNWTIEMTFFTPLIYSSNNKYAAYFYSGSNQIFIGQLRSGIGKGIYTNVGFITIPYATNFYTYGSYSYESPGKWTFVSLIKDGGTTYFYLNGSLYASKSFSYENENNDIRIGNRPDVAPLNGNASLLKIYNRALTPLEIQQNYNALKGRFQ